MQFMGLTTNTHVGAKNKKKRLKYCLIKRKKKFPATFTNSEIPELLLGNIPEKIISHPLSKQKKN